MHSDAAAVRVVAAFVFKGMKREETFEAIEARTMQRVIACKCYLDMIDNCDLACREG
jgi:hypothetical protein